ncbi:MAG: hypothetical protein LBD59_03430 [Prevotellaceae bacterium]|nr:hypothetical protein [Prevotellaceae bacterium]
MQLTNQRERERERERENRSDSYAVFGYYTYRCVIFDTAVFLCPISRFSKEIRNTGIGFVPIFGQILSKTHSAIFNNK